MRQVISVTGNVPHVILGLSLNSQIVKNMAAYSKMLSTVVVDDCPAIMPHAVLDNINSLKGNFPDHSFFWNASCAITVALNSKLIERRKDYAGTFGTTMCRENNICGNDQRVICSSNNIQKTELLRVCFELCRKMGVNEECVSIELRNNQDLPIIRLRELTIHLTLGMINALRNATNCTIATDGVISTNGYKFTQQSYGTMRETLV